jgi:hypothetical protein
MLVKMPTAIGAVNMSVNCVGVRPNSGTRRYASDGVRKNTQPIGTIASQAKPKITQRYRGYLSASVLMSSAPFPAYYTTNSFCLFNLRRLRGILPPKSPASFSRAFEPFGLYSIMITGLSVSNQLGGLMADIKSAREIAMEKIEKLGEATEEERLKWKYIPEGEQLAAKYLKDECNLVAELSQYPEKARKFVRQGAAEVLIRNIGLPRNDHARSMNKKTMEGLRLLKSTRTDLENMFSRLRQLFNHYAEQGEQQRKQAFQTLKADFEGKVQQAVQQQLGTMVGMRIDVEKLPQFQQEWRRALTQLDSQYLSLLNEYKRGLSELG